MGSVTRGRAFIFGLVGGLSMIASCSSTKTGVGQDLLTDITGEVSRRDTITFSLPPPPTLTIENFPLHLSHYLSSYLLVGEANGLRATTLLKFAPFTAWTEERSYKDDAGKTQYETLTITPDSVALDSTAELRVSFWGFATDSAQVTMSGWKTDADWYQEDPVATPNPPVLSSLFSGVAMDSIVQGDIITATFEPGELSSLVTDTLSVALQGGANTMVQLASREGSQTYSPQMVVWVRATVTSSRTEIAARDTAVGLSLRPVQDTHRLERLVSAPTPGPDVLYLAAGTAWRGYVKFERFDIPEFTDEGALPPHTTVNSARLNLTLGDGGYSFERDDAYLQLYALGTPHTLDSLQSGLVQLVSSRASGAGFNTTEYRGDTSLVRWFEIADLVNDWVRQPTTNNGLLLSLTREDRRVDAVEVRQIQLVLVTTRPPLIVERPTPKMESGEADQ